MSMNVYSSEQNSFDFVIVEPLIVKESNSQVDTFLENHLGNGIQHIAFTVIDLVSLVSKLKKKGVSFVKIPSSYYDELAVDFPELPIEILRENNILCESEGSQLLLQIFTEPIGDRPTLFYEFIERINDYLLTANADITTKKAEIDKKAKQISEKQKKIDLAKIDCKNLEEFI